MEHIPGPVNRQPKRERALYSGDPVGDYLKAIGLGHELEIPPEVHEPVDTAYSAEAAQLEVETENLSPFTQWLLRIDRHEHTTQSANPRSVTKVADKAINASDDDSPALAAAREKGKKKKVKDDHRKRKHKEKVKGKEKKKKKKRKKTDDGHSNGDAIELSEDVFSETLADLLAEKGFTEQAITMYEKLRLKYPEKSRLFAAKIETLKQQKL